MAQLVERRLGKAEVTGSNPVSSFWITVIHAVIFLFYPKQNKTSLPFQAERFFVRLKRLSQITYFASYSLYRVIDGLGRLIKVRRDFSVAQALSVKLKHLKLKLA